MAQTVGKLTALKVSRSLEPGMRAEGAGLYLRVTGTGAKSWIYRYQRDDKERPDRTRLAVGCEPCRRSPEGRRGAQVARTAKSVNTFKDCGEAYVAAHKAGWSAKSHQQWTATFETYVYPMFGDSPIREVDTDTVLQ